VAADHSLARGPLEVCDVDLWSRSRVRFPALPDFLSSGGSVTGSIILVSINEEPLERKVAAPV
jgi:hypothetical protein